MNWKCPQCGSEENGESSCRCTCGYEIDEQSYSSQSDADSDHSVKTVSMKVEIHKCPKCGSGKYKYYNARKRGTILFAIALIILPLLLIFDFGGFIITLLTSLLVGWKGLSLFAKGISYYICQDCLFSVDETGKEF